jgi:hypothetical protein
MNIATFIATLNQPVTNFTIYFPLFAVFIID